MKKSWKFFILIVIILFLASNAWGALQVNYNLIPNVQLNSRIAGITQFDLKLDNINTYGFCIEPNRQIGTGMHEYDVLSWQQMGEKYLGAAWLMDTYAPTQSKESTVGLQTAIWAVIEGDYLKYRPVDEIYRDVYTNYLESLSGVDLSLVASALMSSYLLVQPSNSQGIRQALIIKNPVPVPGAALLLGSGLIGLIGFQRRKR